MNKKIVVIVCLVLVFSFVLPTAAVVAKKPPKPPGGGGNTPTGTLFFSYDGWVWSVDADGSDMGKQTQVATGVGVISRQMHGGHYWYVRFEPVDGYYPDGVQQQEIFAVRDDNNMTVQLTNDWTLATSRYSIEPTWGIDDGFLSWSAKRWVQGDSGWEIQEAGIYKQEVQYDTNDNVVGLKSSPVKIWDTGLVQLPDGNWYPNSQGHDWSPDGTKLVHWKRGLYIVDFNNMTESFLTNGNSQEWSPDGTKIACIHNDNLKIINANGTGETVLRYERTSKKWDYEYRAPSWSPDCKFLSYHLAKISFHGTYTVMSEIYIMEIGSETDDCITRSLDPDGYKRNLAWR